MNKEQTFKDRQIKKVIGFLLNNGWNHDTSESEEYYSLYHKDNYSIDISKENGEIVVIADVGDIFHISFSLQNIYTLIGYLVIHPCDNIVRNYKL